jgi:hypothetical protein
VVTARNVILQKGDMVACKERMIQRESCAYALRVDAYTKLPFQYQEPHLVIEKVVVIAQSFGYYHFLAESLSRLAFVYDALLEDTSIKILVAHPAAYVTSFFE